MMNVLVLGSGAREHALAWKLRQSPRVDDLFVGPGNPGTEAVSTNLPLNPLDFESVAAAVRDHRVELVVVGPEDPLAQGIGDFLRSKGILVFGPSRAAARIEASKGFAKLMMARANVPTASSVSFDLYADAASHVRGLPAPPVIKADGLAAGKGVTVAESKEQALDALRTAMVDGAFGDAGRTVVIEERLRGREVSAHAFVAGSAVLSMVYACDHKAIFDGGEGPNTGGMGAFSPPDFVDPALDAEIRRRISEPIARALVDEGCPYHGALYPGLMVTDAGPQVIEFNCRFGDPETQVIMPRLLGDLVEPLMGVATGHLEGVSLDWSSDACVGVVMASGGYPGSFRRGLPVDGLDDVDADVLVFHAGTARDSGDRIVTAGGRVLTVVATGSTLEAARQKVYDNVVRIRFDGRHYRSDIGAASTKAETS